MTLFYYDKSFEGLLTALFDAYDTRLFPEQLLENGTMEPMFTQTIHQVVTDSVKAGRVWQGVVKKTGKAVANMLMCVWLSELPQCDMLLFRYMRKIFDNQHFIPSDFADDDALQAKQIADKVKKERLRIIQFVRFQKASDGTFFAPVTPVYNALPLTLPYFTDRFADQKWFIYDIKREYGYFYDLKQVKEVSLVENSAFVEGKLHDELLAADEKAFQRLWKGYFEAIAIKERLNPTLQRRNMPARFWKFLPEME
jgi:probable DNA metabolism protein